MRMPDRSALGHRLTPERAQNLRHCFVNVSICVPFS
jgi:hypothetical protein